VRIYVSTKLSSYVLDKLFGGEGRAPEAGDVDEVGLLCRVYVSTLWKADRAGQAPSPPGPGIAKADRQEGL
jgi:hypothetical protein